MKTCDRGHECFGIIFNLIPSTLEVKGLGHSLCKICIHWKMTTNRTETFRNCWDFFIIETRANESIFKLTFITVLFNVFMKIYLEKYSPPSENKFPNFFLALFLLKKENHEDGWHRLIHEPQCVDPIDRIHVHMFHYS